MFDKYELEMIARSLGRSLKSLHESKFVGESDPYLAKYEALTTKAKGLAKDA